MPTPTGQISLSDVNLELSKASNALITMNDAAVRTLAGVASGAISMNNLRGKSNITIVTNLSYNNSTYASTQLVDGYAGMQLNYYSDGTYNIYDENTGADELTGNWATPTTANIGTNYWVRFTKTGGTTAADGSATATTGWLQLSSIRTISVTQFNPTTSTRATTGSYTVELSTNSSGTNIVATAAVTLSATARTL